MNGRAEWLREQDTIRGQECDPMLPAAVPTGSALADALSALGLAAAAVVRRLGPVSPTWHIIARLERGRLLAPPQRLTGRGRRSHARTVATA